MQDVSDLRCGMHSSRQLFSISKQGSIELFQMQTCSSHTDILSSKSSQTGSSSKPNSELIYLGMMLLIQEPSDPISNHPDLRVDHFSEILHEIQPDGLSIRLDSRGIGLAVPKYPSFMLTFSSMIKTPHMLIYLHSEILQNSEF